MDIFLRRAVAERAGHLRAACGFWNIRPEFLCAEKKVLLLNV